MDLLGKIRLSLLSEATLAKKMTKLEHHRSLFSTDANPNPSADMAGVIQARIAALRVMQKKPLSSPQEARSLAGKDLAESVVRKVFSDPANPAFRPFLDSRRLNALRAPHNQATAILCDGDILHVPFTAEEAEVLLKELNAEPKWFNFAEKLTQVVPFLPGMRWFWSPVDVMWSHLFSRINLQVALCPIWRDLLPCCRFFAPEDTRTCLFFARWSRLIRSKP